MTKTSLDRRRLLRGMLATGAAVSIPLPLLDIMLDGNGTALAQSAEPVSPLYVTWFFGNGSLPGKWKPAKVGSGSSWELSSQLQPLSSLKSYLTVVSGLTNTILTAGLDHPTGSSGATTGAGLNGNAVKLPSIDQVVAGLIAGNSSFKSLEIGVTPATPAGPQDSLATVSHKGPNAKNLAEYDPKAVFNRLFGGSTSSAASGEALKLARVRTSVLDAVLADGVSLQKKLGAADKQRVEQHLQSIRDIEARLMGSTASQAICQSPAQPTTGKDNNAEAPPGVNTAMSDLAVLALACDRTRVLSYMFSLPAAHVYYRHLTNASIDMNADFHDTICHGDPGDNASQVRVDRGVLYAMTCLNEFLTKMKATPHGAGNLLDSALVYVTSDMGWGKVHSKVEWPVVLAGKAGGKLKGDAHFNYPDGNLSRALLTVARLMGSTATEYGLDSGKVNSTLPGIL